MACADRPASPAPPALSRSVWGGITRHGLRCSTTPTAYATPLAGFWTGLGIGHRFGRVDGPCSFIISLTFRLAPGREGGFPFFSGLCTRRGRGSGRAKRFSNCATVQASALKRGAVRGVGGCKSSPGGGISSPGEAARVSLGKPPITALYQ